MLQIYWKQLMAVVLKNKRKKPSLCCGKGTTLRAMSREEDGNAQSSPQPPLNQFCAKDLGIYGYCRGMSWVTVRHNSFNLEKAGKMTGFSCLEKQKFDVGAGLPP